MMHPVGSLRRECDLFPLCFSPSRFTVFKVFEIKILCLSNQLLLCFFLLLHFDLILCCCLVGLRQEGGEAARRGVLRVSPLLCLSLHLQTCVRPRQHDLQQWLLPAVQVTYNISLLRHVKKRKRRKRYFFFFFKGAFAFTLRLVSYQSVGSTAQPARVDMLIKSHWQSGSANRPSSYRLCHWGDSMASEASSSLLCRLFWQSLLTVLLDTLPCQSFLKGLFDILEVVSGMFLRVINAGGCNDGSDIVVRKLKPCWNWGFIFAFYDSTNCKCKLFLPEIWQWERLNRLAK